MKSNNRPTLSTRAWEVHLCARNRPFKKWCRKVDSNHRPIAYEATALPTELFRHDVRLYRFWRDLGNPGFTEMAVPALLLGTCFQALIRGRKSPQESVSVTLLRAASPFKRHAGRRAIVVGGRNIVPASPRTGRVSRVGVRCLASRHIGDFVDAGFGFPANASLEAS